MKLEPIQEQYLRAQIVAPGIAIGEICRAVSEIADLGEDVALDIEADFKSWQKLVDRARKQIRQQLKPHALDSGEYAVFEMHLQLLSDPGLHSQIESHLLKGFSIERALHAVLDSWRLQFQQLKSALFRERLLDLQDVILRLFRLAEGKKSAKKWPQNVCIYSKLALPSCMMEVPPPNLKAVLCCEVSMASHLAMLARSRGLPCLSKVQLPPHLDSSLVIVDGYEGWLILHPSAATLTRYREKLAKLQQAGKAFDEANLDEANRKGSNSKAPSAPAVSGSPTGIKVSALPVRLHVNIDSWRDVQQLPPQGYEGVGLVRTEYMAYESGQLPTLRVQIEFYRRILNSQRGKEVVFRLFDFGSDKPLMRQMKSPEVNPALGCRGVRFLLKEPMILKDQLRALLQVHKEMPLSILVPMVCTPSQMQRVRAMMDELMKAMKIGQPPRLGMMIEVPAAALQLDQFAPFTDFYSLGTNDLLQYVHAVDRNNHGLEELYNPLSPALLNLIDYVVRIARAQGKPISICGEMASDQTCFEVLQRMGLSDFSVHPRHLLQLNKWLSSRYELWLG